MCVYLTHFPPNMVLSMPLLDLSMTHSD